MTYSSWTLGYQGPAEGCFGESEGDRPALTPRFQFSRRGCFQGYAQIVRAARSRKAGLQRRSQNAFSIAQQVLNMVEGKALKKVFGGDPCPGGEEPMKMESA